MLRVRRGLDRCQARVVALRREEMREALLQPQVVVDWHTPADARRVGHVAVFGLEEREQPALHRRPRDLDGVGRRGAPAQRARHVDVHVARAANAHGACHLRFEIAQIGDTRGRDVGNAVRHGDARHVLAGAGDVARRGSDRRRGRSARRGRRGAGTLHAGVHVRLVVVADVEHVVVALEHSRETSEADVGGAAVAALRDHAHVVAALHAHRRGDARRDRRGVAEQRMNPRDLPRGLRVRRGEHFEAAGRVDGDDLVVRGAHRRIDGVARAERLAATLAGAMPRVERVAARGIRLHRALVLVEQAVADGERPGLVELHRRAHQPILDATDPSCRSSASAVGPVRPP